MAKPPGANRSTAEPRDELLNISEFGSLTEAQVVIEDWRKRIQHLEATLSTRRAHPHRVRCLSHAPTKTSRHTHSGRTNYRGPRQCLKIE